MWIGDKIFFNSDRTGTLNLYAYDVASGQAEPVTQSRQWDVRWPSADDAGRIVYEMDGELHVLDTRTKQDRQLAIQVPYEGLYDRPSQVPAARNVEDWALSPKGERALFVARGDIFTAPIEKGPTRNLTRSSNAHDKWARWSPDGRRIAFTSDKSGEEEVWLVNQDGSGKPEQLTQGGKAMRYAPEWAPDGKRLAFSDKDGKLYVLTIADRKLTEIADNPYTGIRDYSWSPCGGHLAYSNIDPNQLRTVWIWSAEDGKARRVTSELRHETSPFWDLKGEYLFYLAAREYAPQLDAFELNFANSRNTGMFALALRKDVKSLLPFESDEVSLEEEGKKKEEKK